VAAYGAGEGNRTLTTSLEGWGSTIELHPQALVFGDDEGRKATGTAVLSERHGTKLTI
jgi:hypothetical protein